MIDKSLLDEELDKLNSGYYHEEMSYFLNFYRSCLDELKEARLYLKTIEDIARDAFNDPETLDINYYRAQALANIYAIFEYNGTTIKREEG